MPLLSLTDLLPSLIFSSKKFFEGQRVNLRTVYHLTMNQTHGLQSDQHHAVVELVKSDEIAACQLWLIDQQIGDASKSGLHRSLNIELAVLCDPIIYFGLGLIYWTRE